MTNGRAMRGMPRLLVMLVLALLQSVACGTGHTRSHGAVHSTFKPRGQDENAPRAVPVPKTGAAAAKYAAEQRAMDESTSIVMMRRDVSYLKNTIETLLSRVEKLESAGAGAGPQPATDATSGTTAELKTAAAADSTTDEKGSSARRRL